MAIPTVDNCLYIASGLANFRRIRVLRDRFLTLGVGVTYDWTSHLADPDAVPVVTDESLLPGIAVAEVRGVMAAKAVLMVMPAGRGSHFEMGLAYGWQKPIVLLAEPTKDRPIAFHSLNSIERHESEDSAVAAIMAILAGRRKANHLTCEPHHDQRDHLQT